MTVKSPAKTPETGAEGRRSGGAVASMRRLVAGLRPPRREPARSESWAARRLGLVMLVLGGVAVALGLLLLGVALRHRLAFHLAMTAPPPPLAPLRADAPPQAGPFDELAITAQLDRPRAYLAAGGSVWIAPLYPPDAERPADPVTAMVFEREGALPEAAFAGWVLAVGPAGTLVELRGAQVEPHAALRRQAAAALRAEGLTLAENAVFLDPFLRPREEELAPSRLAVPFTLGIIGAGAVMALLGHWRRRTSRRRADDKAAAKTAETPPATKEDAPEKKEPAA